MSRNVSIYMWGSLSNGGIKNYKKELKIGSLRTASILIEKRTISTRRQNVSSKFRHIAGIFALASRQKKTVDREGCSRFSRPVTDTKTSSHLAKRNREKGRERE
ncbi:uncharacterized protein LOC122511583 [Leptopilina heterotoma]|uniref:uncharacterized protein LOC122511583 n=1 Tax=Leptopilina heterotoma TaxID=63436 RepID=UPI001CA806D6|nr:uncharacterized protein LOC122511583 [Leptopilina heterotoma]XP_043482873.1 uncharacterized protein LOC122511583 [Leptopilina heterotoma]